MIENREDTPQVREANNKNVYHVKTTYNILVEVGDDYVELEVHALRFALGQQEAVREAAVAVVFVVQEVHFTSNSAFNFLQQHRVTLRLWDRHS